MVTRSVAVACVVAWAASFAGCVVAPYVEPLSTQRIIELSEEEKGPEEIIAEINRSRTVYVLRARDVKDLLNKGVSETVVDHMLDTRIRDLQSYYYRDYYHHDYYYPYYHGHYRFGYFYCR